jgi:hypothetical protein
MNSKIYNALQEMGWRFEDFDDFMFWANQSNIIINDHLREFMEKQYDSLTEALGFALDVLRVLLDEGGK